MLQRNNVTQVKVLMDVKVIVPDNRGRVLLGKVTNSVADHYLASVNDDGIITLVPAVVRPEIVERMLELDPTVLDRISEQLLSGEEPAASELWDQIKAESGDGR